MTFNPFKQDSRSYEITARQDRGESMDKIVKDLKLKDRRPIYAVNTELKKRRKLAGISAQAKAKAEGEEEEKPLVGSTESSSLEAFKKDILRSVNMIVKGVDQSEVADGERIQVDEGTLVKRTLYLTPKTLIFYDTAKSAGYPGDLSAYVNDMVNTVYEKKNIALGLTQRMIL